MAIQVSGTEVISNARALNNIASVDATTAAAISAGGVGGGDPIIETMVGVIGATQIGTNKTVIVPAKKTLINNTTGYSYITETATALGYIGAAYTVTAKHPTSGSSSGTTWTYPDGRELWDWGTGDYPFSPSGSTGIPQGSYTTGGSGYSTNYVFTVYMTYSTAFIAKGFFWQPLYQFGFEMQVLDGTWKTMLPMATYSANTAIPATQNLGISSGSYRFNVRNDQSGNQLAFYALAPYADNANPSGKELTFDEPAVVGIVPTTLTAYIIVDGSGTWGVFGSRNGGTNYSTGTLVSTQNLGYGLKSLKYTINVSSQPSGSTINLKTTVPTTLGNYYGAGVYAT